MGYTQFGILYGSTITILVIPVSNYGYWTHKVKVRSSTDTTQVRNWPWSWTRERDGGMSYLYFGGTGSSYMFEMAYDLNTILQQSVGTIPTELVGRFRDVSGTTQYSTVTYTLSGVLKDVYVYRKN